MAGGRQFADYRAALAVIPLVDHHRDLIFQSEPRQWSCRKQAIGNSGTANGSSRAMQG
jgi:hypothetical protein